MTRFEVGTTDEAGRLRLARETATDRVVVLEAPVGSERLRQLQAIPPCASIAPFERIRDGYRLRLVHPAPLELTAPVDEFDVAQAIGSMLDGLAWLHGHGATHGAVSAASLVAGPTGGRLSLAGAFSRDGTATPADDVFAASALAFNLLVGADAGPESHNDPRLTHYASPAVAEAVGAGLHPDAAQRPSAALLATMVRGEFLPPVWDAAPRESLLVRLQSSVAQLLRARGGAAVGIGAALALCVVVAALASADQSVPPAMAMSYSLAEEPTAAIPSTRADRASTTTSTVPPAVVTTSTELANPASPRVETPAPVVVLSAVAAAPNNPPPPTTVAAPPPTTLAIAPPTTAAPTTTAPPTTRVVTTPTTRATPTTKPPPTTKPKKAKDDDDDDDDDDDADSIVGGLVSLLTSLLP